MNIKNYINGQYINPLQDNWIDNYCPANGVVYGQIPNSSKADVENAFITAKAAFLSWSQTTLEARSRILIKISELIEKDGVCFNQYSINNGYNQYCRDMKRFNSKDELLGFVVGYNQAIQDGMIREIDAVK